MQAIRPRANDSREPKNPGYLIAHQNCAYYRAKHGRVNEEDLRRRQVEDLRSARKRLRGRGLEVRLVYAGIQDGQVLFTEVEGPAG